MVGRGETTAYREANEVFAKTTLLPHISWYAGVRHETRKANGSTHTTCVAPVIGIVNAGPAFVFLLLLCLLLISCPIVFALNVPHLSSFFLRLMCSAVCVNTTSGALQAAQKLFLLVAYFTHQS